MAPGDADLGTVLVSPDPTDAQALAAAFMLTTNWSDVSISVEMACLQCQAQFYLIADAIGPGSDFVTNVRAVTTVDTLGGSGFLVQSTPLFAGLTLDAGTYYLVMALTNETISGAIWAATQAPIVTAAAGASNLSDWLAASAGYNSTTPPLSMFDPYQVDAVDTYLRFTVSSVDQVAAPVPEPATVLLLVTGLAALARRRRS